MPKELRKRGKRAKKSAKEKEEDSYIVYAKPEESRRRAAAVAGEEYVEEEEQENQEDGLQPEASSYRDVNAGDGQYPPSRESIWPLLDADTKAYFKQLEEKIVGLEELHAYGKAKILDRTDDNAGDEEEEEELDDRVLILRAALTQLVGKETSTAADPETSIILERLIYSMDDFARRVLADRFIGHYKDLAQDRFASHVLQTLLVLGGGETVERERKGIIAKAPTFSSTSASAEDGELPTMTEAIIALTREVLEDVPTLVTSQHGSYILRVLLVLLSGRALPFNSETSTTSASAIARSKKSARWKAHRTGGQMKSFVPGQDGAASAFDKGKASERRIVPRPFQELLVELMDAVDAALCGGSSKDTRLAAQQCRQKSDDPVATGLVQILLEIEVDQGRSEEKDSMMDRLLEGLITEYNANPTLQQPARSDFIETLLRSSVSSHVLEVIISNSPQSIFDLIFKMYFQGRISRLAGHPVANFVMAKVVERASKEQTEIVADEIPEALEGIIENSRTGVLKALMEKSVLYSTKGPELHKMLLNAFQTKAEDEIQHLLPCGLSLMTLKLYKRNPAYVDTSAKSEYLTQGALLLQAWLRIPSSPVSASILATPFQRLLVLASDPVASRVIDIFLDEDNKAVSPKDRRTFLRNLIGNYHLLASDRIGSRIADRCWKVADPFLKVKIATSLVPEEYSLGNSQFGHYFLRKVNLPLFNRNLDEWKSRQARDVGGTPAELHAQAARQQQEQQAKAQAAAAAAERAAAVATPMVTEAETAELGVKEKKKRKKDKVVEIDEIDEVFKTAKKAKSGR